MNKLGRLIKNELLKKIKQPSTIVLSTFFIVISFIIPFFMIPSQEEYWYGGENRIDMEIQNLTQQINAVGSDAPEYIKGQYTNAIAFFEKAKKYELKPDDWRYDMLFEIYYKVRENYVVSLILDGTINPKDMGEKTQLEDYTGILYNGEYGEKNKEQLNALYTSNKSQIDSIWQVIENNDYKFYCQKLIEGYDITITMAEQRIPQLKKLIEDKPYDYNLKSELISVETELETVKSDKALAEYRVKADIPFDKEWRDQTINKISENNYQIANAKRQLFELENASEQGYNMYDTYGLSKEENISALKKMRTDFEERNKISWYSLENNIPHMYNVDDSRINATWYFSTTMFAAIIALFIASNIVSGEFSTKTINMLIIRPVKRWKIITSKYIAVLIFAYSIYIAGMLANVLSVGLTVGFPQLSIPYLFVAGDTVQSMSFILYMLQNMLFCSINIVFMVTVVFMMSTLTKNTALSAISGMGLYFLSTILFQILLAVKVPLSVLRYTILPYFDLSQFAIKNDYMQTFNYLLLPEFGAGLLITLSALMFAISLIVFNKRDVK